VFIDVSCITRAGARIHRALETKKPACAGLDLLSLRFGERGTSSAPTDKQDYFFLEAFFLPFFFALAMLALQLTG
jgi:hypothetical protein